jgi:N-methylhydantoinase A
LQAPIAYEAVHSLPMPIDRFDATRVNEVFADLRREAEAIVHFAGSSQALTERRFVDMRYRGQGHELNVELPVRRYSDADAATCQDLFNRQYRKHYSRTIPNLSVEALTWTLVLSTPPRTIAADTIKPELAAAPAPIERHKQVFDPDFGDFVTAAVIQRPALRPGSTFDGPALIMEDQTTTYVPTGFHGTVSAHGHLILKNRQSE